MSKYSRISGRRLKPRPKVPRYVLALDGVNSYVSINDSSLFSPAAMTISTWFNAKKAPYDVGLVCKYNNPYEWALYYTSNRLYFLLKDSGGDFIARYDSDGSEQPQAGSWHMATVVWDGGTTASSIKLYLDSVRVDDANDGSGVFNGLLDSTSPVWIGARGFGGSPTDMPFDGEINEVRIYNRALSATEVNNLFAGQEIQDSALVMHHKYSLGHARDLSGNGNHGTLKGGAKFNIVNYEEV